MSYIGNMPEFNIVHTNSDRYDYVFASNPTIDVNPAVPYATWLNTLTGEVFVCKDNTIGGNIWVGNAGTVLGIILAISSLTWFDGAPENIIEIPSENYEFGIGDGEVLVSIPTTPSAAPLHVIGLVACGLGGAGNRRWFLSIDLSGGLSFSIDDDISITEIVIPMPLSSNITCFCRILGESLEISLDGVDYNATPIISHNTIDSGTLLTIGGLYDSSGNLPGYEYSGGIDYVAVKTGAVFTQPEKTHLLGLL